MDHDRTNPEPAVARAQRPPWGLEEILGIGLLLALLLLAVAYVAAGIIEAGASPQTNPLEVTTVYATEWASPYVALFPLAALAIAWWQLRRWGPSLEAPSVVEAGAEDEEGDSDAGFAHLLRARGTAAAAAVALIVIVFAAIGVAVTSLLLFPSSEASGSQVWPSEAETLANAAGALVLGGIGLAVALHLWRGVSDRLAGETDEEVVEAAVVVTAPAPE